MTTNTPQARATRERLDKRDQVRRMYAQVVTLLEVANTIMGDVVKLDGDALGSQIAIGSALEQVREDTP
jgi:hypothetical protein